MKIPLLIFRSCASIAICFSLSGTAVAATITSTATGNWSATAWPNTLRSGTIVTSTGSVNVTGSGTSFTTQLSVGNILKTAGNVVIGTILSVNSNTSVTLTANAASTNSGITYDVQGIGSGDAAVILGGTSITIDNAYAACTSLSSAATGAASAWGLVFNAGSHLTVGGTVTVGGASRPGSINMTGGGILTCKGLAVTNAGTWTPGAGTVELTAANTLPATFFTSFNDLTISAGNTSTAAALTIGGSLSIANGGTTSFTAAGFALTVNGTTTVGNGASGTLIISSATGAKSFQGPVIISTGAFWTNSANAPVNFRQGIINSGTFTAGSGMQTFTTNNQNVTGTFGIPNVTVTGVTLTNIGTLTITTALAGTGTLLQGSGSTLNINFTGLPSIAGLTADSLNNIVSYGFAGTQTVLAAHYYNLALGNSGVKTMQTATALIDGGLTLSGTANMTSVTGLTVGGDVTIGAGTTWNAAAFTHTLQGNFINAGSFNPGAGTILFGGSGQQDISNTGTAAFNNLTVNNSGGGIQWENPFVIGGTLAMTQGNIDLNGNSMTLGSSGTSIGALAYNTGTIIDQAGGGSFTRWFSTAAIPDGNSAGLFPVGTVTDYNPIAVSAPASGPTTGGAITVAYTDAGANTPVNVLDAGFTIVVRKDLFWMLATGSGLAGGTYDLSASGTDFGTVGAVTDLRLMLANSVVGTAGINAGTDADPQVNRTALAFGDLSNSFYIGSTNASSSPLPITLVSFTAVPLSGTVKLNWETASEHNNAYFTVQRSSDAANWQAVTTVAGAGNSNMANWYSAVDEKPYANVSYYRLQQTDLDGENTFSKTVSVDLTSPVTTLVYPNPATNDVFVTTAGAGPLAVIVYNILGETIHPPIYLNGNNNAHLDLSALPAGLYYIRIVQQTTDETKTILKIK